MTRALAAAASIWLLASACGGNAECDKASLALVCDYSATAGECVDFAGLSTADSKSAKAGCTTRGGVLGTTACPAARLGTCSIPPTALNIDVSCSPHGVISAHYLPPPGPGLPGFTAATAQQNCTAVKGATFTPD